MRMNKSVIIKIVFQHFTNTYFLYIHISTWFCNMFYFLRRTIKEFQGKEHCSNTTVAFFFLKEARFGLFWFCFILFCFLLGASLWIHSEKQGLVLVAPAYGIDKLYFDGYTFRVSFLLFISLGVEKFP